MLTVSGTKLKVNDLSPELREKLQQRFSKLGKKVVTYKFHISHRNPDPEKHGGDRLLPITYVLQPITYYIEDQGSKKIGLPKNQLDIHGDPTGYDNISLRQKDKAVLSLNLETAAGRDRWAYLEMHPGNINGMFPDAETGRIFEYIDEIKDAKTRRERRRVREDAMSVATDFTIQQSKDFASAMGWDENMDEDLLADKIASLAETDPNFFAEFVSNAAYSYRANITRAEAANLIIWIGEEYKYVWGATRETIVAFGRQENADRLGRFTEWLISDKTGQAIYDKIKNLLKTLNRSTPALAT